jgi:hypothetical protein
VEVNDGVLCKLRLGKKGAEFAATAITAGSRQRIMVGAVGRRRRNLVPGVKAISPKTNLWRIFGHCGLGEIEKSWNRRHRVTLLRLI